MLHFNCEEQRKIQLVITYAALYYRECAVARRNTSGLSLADGPQWDALHISNSIVKLYSFTWVSTTI